MDLSAVNDALGHIGVLDKSLYGAAVVLAVLVRFARAYAHIGDPQTFFAAMGLGLGGAMLNLGVSHGTWHSSAFQGIALGVGVLVVEFALRKAGDKIPWIPSDGQFAQVKPVEGGK